MSQTASTGFVPPTLPTNSSDPILPGPMAVTALDVVVSPHSSNSVDDLNPHTNRLSQKENKILTENLWLNEQLQILVSENFTLKARVGSLEGKVCQLDAEKKDAVEKNLNNAHEENGIIKTVCNKIRTKFQNLDSKKKDIGVKNQKQLIEIQEEVEQVDESLKTLVSESQKTIEEQLDEIKRLNDVLIASGKEIVQLKDELKTQKSNNVVLEKRDKKQTEKINKLSTENGNLKKYLYDAVQNWEKQVKRSEELEAQAKELIDILKHNEKQSLGNLSTKKHVMDKDYRVLDKDYRSRQTTLEQMVINEVLEEKDEMIKKLSLEKDNLETKLSNTVYFLKEHMEWSRKLENKNTDLANKLEEQKSKNKTKFVFLEIAKDEMENEYRYRQTILQQELEHLYKKCVTLELDNTSLQEHNKNQTKEHFEELKMLLNAQNEMNSQISYLKETVNVEETNGKNLEEQKQKLYELCKKLEEEVEELEQEAYRYLKAVHKQMKLTEVMEKRNKELTKKLDEGEQEVESLKRKVDDLNDQLKHPTGPVAMARMNLQLAQEVPEKEVCRDGVLPMIRQNDELKSLVPKQDKDVPKSSQRAEMKRKCKTPRAATKKMKS